MIHDLEIFPKDLLKLNKNEYQLLDVREKWEKDAADIGGILIPFNSLPSILDNKELSKVKLIVYCHHGVRSLAAVKYLRSIGLNNSYSLSGGIDRWSCEIDNTITRYI